MVEESGFQLGLAGIALFMFILAAGFNAATYSLSGEDIEHLSEHVEKERLFVIQDEVFKSDVQFKNKLNEILGSSAVKEYESELIAGAIDNNPWLILIGILGFVASFAITGSPLFAY